MLKVIAEVDSMLLKMAIGVSNFAFVPTGGLIHEIKVTSSTWFSCFSVSYCPRSCNTMAHDLVARGCMCSPNADLFWDGVPVGMENLVAGGLTAPITLQCFGPDATSFFRQHSSFVAIHRVIATFVIFWLR